MEKKRDSRVTIDLLDLKQPWLDWCEKQGVNPASAFRQVVANLTQAEGQSVEKTPIQAVIPKEIEPEAPEPPVTYRKLALTDSEFRHVSELAEKEGFSVAKWLTALVRSRLTSTAQFGQSELELLARSNLLLRNIGRNLNQIAKVLNTDANASKALRFELIEELEKRINTHTQGVADLIAANTERWRIK